MPSPITYNLIIGEANGQQRILRKQQDGKTVRFSKPVTNKGGKVYVLQDPKGDIIYVGHTIRSIGQIALRGHTPYNYKWLTVGDYTELKLSVFMLDIPGDCEDAKLYGESIEAELVYLVREQTGHWPAGQNEIHFNNDHPENARLRAREMYDVMVP